MGTQEEQRTLWHREHVLYLECHRATHVTRGSGSLQCHPQHCAFGGALGSPPGRGTPASGASFGGGGSRGRPQCHPGLKTGPREGLLRAGWARSCENSPQRGPRPWEGICLCSREGSAACPAQREARCSAPRPCCTGCLPDAHSCPALPPAKGPPGPRPTGASACPGLGVPAVLSSASHPVSLGSTHRKRPREQPGGLAGF